MCNDLGFNSFYCMKNLKGAFMKDVYAYNFRYLETSYYLNGRFFLPSLNTTISRV